ncbi:MAG: hypothetical protein HY843_03840 [Bdellovibrio sp.]|nr:hypothetical protein [Bdellovibrio sp.]
MLLFSKIGTNIASINIKMYAKILITIIAFNLLAVFESLQIQYGFADDEKKSQKPHEQRFTVKQDQQKSIDYDRHNVLFFTPYCIINIKLALEHIFYGEFSKKTDLIGKINLAIYVRNILHEKTAVSKDEMNSIILEFVNEYFSKIGATLFRSINNRLLKKTGFYDLGNDFIDIAVTDKDIEKFKIIHDLIIKEFGDTNETRPMLDFLEIYLNGSIDGKDAAYKKIIKSSLANLDYEKDGERIHNYLESIKDADFATAFKINFFLATYQGDNSEGAKRIRQDAFLRFFAWIEKGKLTLDPSYKDFPDSKTQEGLMFNYFLSLIKPDKYKIFAYKAKKTAAFVGKTLKDVAFKGTKTLAGPLQTIVTLTAMSMSQEFVASFEEFLKDFKAMQEEKEPGKKRGLFEKAMQSYTKAKYLLAKFIEETPEKFKHLGSSTQLWMQMGGTGLLATALTPLEKLLLAKEPIADKVLENQVKNMSKSALAKQEANTLAGLLLKQTTSFSHWFHYSHWGAWEFAGSWFRKARDDFNKRITKLYKDGKISRFVLIDQERTDNVYEVLFDEELRDEFLQSLFNVITNNEDAKIIFDEFARRFISFDFLATYELVSVGSEIGGVLGGRLGQVLGARVCSAIGGRLGGALGASCGPIGFVAGSIIGAAAFYPLKDIPPVQESLEKLDEITINDGKRAVADFMSLQAVGALSQNVTKDKENNKKNKISNPNGVYPRQNPPLHYDPYTLEPFYNPNEKGPVVTLDFLKFHNSNEIPNEIDDELSDPSRNIDTRFLSHPTIKNLVDSANQIQCAKENEETVISAYLRSMALRMKNFYPIISNYFSVSEDQEHIFDILTDAKADQIQKEAAINQIIALIEDYNEKRSILDQINATKNDSEWESLRDSLPSSRTKPGDRNLDPDIKDFTKDRGVFLYEALINKMQAEYPILKVEVAWSNKDGKKEIKPLYAWVNELKAEIHNKWSDIYGPVAMSRKDQHIYDFLQNRENTLQNTPPKSTDMYSYEQNYLDRFMRHFIKIGEKHAEPGVKSPMVTVLRTKRKMPFINIPSLVGKRDLVKLFTPEETRQVVHMPLYADLSDDDQVIHINPGFLEAETKRIYELSSPTVFQHAVFLENEIKKIITEGAVNVKKTYEEDGPRAKKLLSFLNTELSETSKTYHKNIILDYLKYQKTKFIDLEAGPYFVKDLINIAMERDIANTQELEELLLLALKEKYAPISEKEIKSILEFNALRGELFTYLKSLKEKIKDCEKFQCEKSTPCGLDPMRKCLNRGIKERLTRTEKMIEYLQDIFRWSEGDYDFMFIKARHLAKWASEFDEKNFLTSYGTFMTNKQAVRNTNGAQLFAQLDAQVAQEHFVKHGPEDNADIYLEDIGRALQIRDEIMKKRKEKLGIGN